MTITLSAAKSVMLAGAIVLGCVVSGDAQPHTRVHSVTDAALVALRHTPPATEVDMQIQDKTRMSAQSHRSQMPLHPQPGTARDLLRAASFGVAVIGVPLDTNAAEFWQDDPQSGWSYNALGGAVALGLEANCADMQPTCAYHHDTCFLADTHPVVPRYLMGKVAIGFVKQG